jgi:hypothetical protein
MERLRAFTQSMVIAKPGQPRQSSPYAPLPNPNSICLLDILPARRGRPLQTTLKVIDLNHAPSFEALPYVWGSPENLVNILCNGMSMTVTRNLGAALQRLRGRFRRRTVWIDALCINQNNLDETPESSLFHVLITYTLVSFSATDPRDKVFALLSLSHSKTRI